MQAYQIIAGFSDIKSEFLTKTRTKKLLTELRLWFSFDGDILYVHDHNDHKTNIVLAAHRAHENLWRIFLRNGSYGEQLVNDVIKTATQAELAKKLNEKYKLYGFFLFSKS